MMPPTSIDGTDITGATIDGTDVTEITVDGQTVFTAGPVPDSGLLQARYDFSQEDGSTPVTDLTGNGYDLTGSYSGIAVTINGTQAGRFDGTDDVLDGSWSSISAPYYFFAVVELSNAGAAFDPIISGTDSDRHLIASNANQDWFIGTDAGFVTAGVSDNLPHIFEGAFENGNVNLLVDGTVVVNTSLATNSSDNIRLGANFPETNYADMKVGEVLPYTAEPDRAAVRSYLANKWDITL
jgi:hypothetical protein